MLEEMDRDPDVGKIVIRGAHDVYNSGDDVNAFPDIAKNSRSNLHWNITATERIEDSVICAMEKYAFGVGFEWRLQRLQVRYPENPGQAATKNVHNILILNDDPKNLERQFKKF